MPSEWIIRNYIKKRNIKFRLALQILKQKITKLFSVVRNFGRGQKQMSHTQDNLASRAYV
jgi:hypothetical protein